MVWIFRDADADVDVGTGIGAAAGLCNPEPARGTGLRITLLLAEPNG